MKTFLDHRIGLVIAAVLLNSAARAQQAAPGSDTTPATTAAPAPAEAPAAAPNPAVPASATPEATPPEATPAVAAPPAEPPATSLLPKVRRSPPPPPPPARPSVTTGARDLDEDTSRLPAPEVPALDAWLGAQGNIVSSAGYDLFSSDDMLAAFTAGAGVRLLDFGATSLAAVATVNIGGAEDTVRGQAAELSVLSLSLGPELRFPLASRVYLYGRVSPVAVRTNAELADTSSATTLEQSGWQWGADAALGAAMRIGEARPSAHASPVCFYVRLEGGYAALAATDLELTPRGSDAPIRAEPLALGELSLSGVSFRTAIGLGY